MHNCKGSIWIIFFRFLLCLWACGCSDDAGMPAPPAGADRVTACVRLSVRVAWETTRAAVQADATVEEKISSVAVFLVSVDGSGNEDWNDGSRGRGSGLSCVTGGYCMSFDTGRGKFCFKEC